MLSLIMSGAAGMMGRGAFAAQPESVQTAKCRELTRHVPDADVNYRPGQDVVAGEPVVPADLDGAAQVQTPQNFDIEIDADLTGGLAGGQAPSPYQPRAKIGRVEVKDLEGDTTLSFNGQPLHKGGQQALSTECAE